MVQQDQSHSVQTFTERPTCAALLQCLQAALWNQGCKKYLLLHEMKNGYNAFPADNACECLEGLIAKARQCILVFEYSTDYSIV